MRSLCVAASWIVKVPVLIQYKCLTVKQGFWARYLQEQWKTQYIGWPVTCIPQCHCHTYKHIFQTPHSMNSLLLQMKGVSAHLGQLNSALDGHWPKPKSQVTRSLTSQWLLMTGKTALTLTSTRGQEVSGVLLPDNAILIMPVQTCRLVQRVGHR